MRMVLTQKTNMGIQASPFFQDVENLRGLLSGYAHDPIDGKVSPK